jgi:hypothetical protein
MPSSTWETRNRRMTKLPKASSLKRREELGCAMTVNPEPSNVLRETGTWGGN